ncbi:MAG TPA: fibronectin type III domain-containing protein, partial [Bdellovibrionota bacterium]|nr:fibronectin type III domain-containing protein [Bdellovibrionota bacterium]
IPVTPPNTPPCPIVLSVESGGDPTTEIRLSWVEVSENGDSSEGACVPSGGAVSSLDLKYRPGGTDFSDADFISGTGMTVIAQEDDGSTLAPKAPGLVHQRLLQGLTPATTYIFAIRSMDPQGLRSPVSNHASFSTDPVVVNLVGNGQFVNLRENLPMSPGSVQRLSINVENSVNILPDLMGGHPWILLADPSNGVQILKVADAYNVSCLDRFGVLDPVCALNVDIEPRDWMSPARWVGDGQPDFIDRDRHILRTGSADCDGVNAVQQNSPSTADWSRVDTFVRCNLPKDPVYAENIYKAAMVAVRAVNNDPYDDLVLANLSALQVPDAVYINSGQDLCPTRPLGGADVADGIPCFSPPIKLPPQLANSKLPSSRVKLYDAVDNDGGADLILVMTGRQEIGGFSAYSNHCKSRTGSCQADDFRLETGLFDVGGDNSLLPLYCEDVLFVDLNNDDVNDVLCVRSESFTSPNNHGLNLTFRASRPSANADGLPHFVLDPNLFPAATLDNCNHSFATSARGGNGQDYLLVGYRKLGGGSAGRGIACKTRLFAGSGNSFSDIALPGMNNNDNCLNGALADSRGLGRIDAVIACGQLEDISSDFGGDTSFRGAKILLNGGINLGIGGSDLGMNVFQNFEANGIRLYQPQFNAVTGEPTQLPGAPIVFDFDAGLPGAVNAIGLGDLNNDGVPDVYFGNGGTSIGEAGIDLIFRQMSR